MDWLCRSSTSQNIGESIPDSASAKGYFGTGGVSILQQQLPQQLVTPVDHMGLCVCVNVIKHRMNVCDWWMRFLVRKYFECSNKYKGMTFASINIWQKP